MLYFKLQLGCLVVTLYFIINYIKGTIGAKYSCNKIFDAMMVTAPQAIIFDGVTAWTVNHLDIVPYKLNLALHCIFFVFMAVTVFLLYLYIMELTIGFNNKPQIICSCIPGAVTFVLILAFLNKLEFLQGKITNYSMGFSVIVCYISVVLHFAAILILIIFKHKSLEKKKILGIVSFLALFLTILIIQIILPEVLLSALLPAISILGVYMNFENPSLKQLEIYNKNMVTSFATLVESRDGSTGGHIRRTKGYVEIILKQMKKNRVHRKELTKDYIENVISAAPMHDVGKISTPDYILQKPGKLTPEEYEIMKQHSVEGGKILEKTFKTLDEPEYQKIAYEVARYHH